MSSVSRSRLQLIADDQDTSASQLAKRLIETKLNPPASNATQVLRTAICDQVCAGAARLVVLVRAPAGFGKTTAMIQSRAHLEGMDIETAWLTLDRSDNDLSRFLHCLREATLRWGLELPSICTPIDLIQALAAHDSPFALFLDDFETVHEPAVLGLVHEIINHLPRRGQLIIGSRSLPMLDLGRLRARGQLVEIDADRLRFSLEETGAFFAMRRPLNLSADMLYRLHRKTEGWIAALWLASMALERHPDQTDFIERFSGSDRTVADYLAEDVLAQQSPEVRTFLFRTSILRHLDASVCQALNPGIDCGRMLDQLDAANLFVTPVSGKQRGWRYHSLFADYLRSQLERECPDALPQLHLAASTWYQEQSRPVLAIDHAIEGGDYRRTLRLLEDHAEHLIEQGRMRLLSRWFQALPPPLLHEYPFLRMAAIWAACFTQGPWVAMQMLEQLDCDDESAPDVQAYVNTLRPMLLAMQDRSEEAARIGRESLARLPTSKPFADSALLNALAATLSVVGDKQEAQGLLDAARRECAWSTFNRMYSDSLEGIFSLHEGRLRQATAYFRMAVDATHAVTYNHTNGNAWAGVLYAYVVYEINQLDQANHLLNVYLPLVRDMGLPDHMILSHVMRSRIAFISGDVDGALYALTELEYLGHQRKLERVVASAKLERSRLLMLQGHALASREELMRANDPALWDRERCQRLFAHDLDYLTLGQIRWEIAFGDAAATLPLLDKEIDAAVQAVRNRRALTLRLLRSLALQRGGYTAAAFTELGLVLQVTSQEGFMRQILDEGPAMGGLIQQYSKVLHDSGGARDPILIDYLQRLLQAFGPIASEFDAPRKLPKGVPDSLTHKEIRVLHLLAEGYSNNTMAEKLFVSDSTVRTHLRNINIKLDAESRTEAMAIARKLGIIP